MESAALNYLDYVILGILFLSTLFGFVRGFIGSFLSLSGWCLSIYLTYTLFPEFKPILEPKIKNPLILMMVGHSVLMLCFLIIFGVFNLLTTTAISGITKGPIDRSMGALFGMFRAALICSFVFFTTIAALSTFNGSTDEKSIEATLPKMITSAKTYSALNAGREVIKDVIPDSFYVGLNSAYAQMTNKAVEEEMAEMMIGMLSKHLDSEQIDRLTIDEKSNDPAASDKAAKLQKLKILMEALKEQRAGGVSDNLSESDLAKIEELLQNHSNKKEIATPSTQK